MEKIPQVETAEAHRFFGPDGLARIHVMATGTVPTSGWSGIRLLPAFPVTPPADGIWQFSMLGDAPSGLVLPVLMPVHAQRNDAMPDWLQGVSVNGVRAALSEEELAPSRNDSFITEYKQRLAARSHVIVRETVASFDDSFNPIGFCSGFSIKMKKLSHTLTLVVEGPDEGRIRECIGQATGVGLVAAIVAVYMTGGGALGVAVSAFVSSLQGCLGDSFSARIDDESHWVEWCT